MRHEKCKGCYTDVYTGIKCPIQSRNQLALLLKCPCLDCLVKGICIHVCKEYTKIRRQAIELETME